MSLTRVLLLSKSYSVESKELRIPSDDSTLLAHAGTKLALLSNTESLKREPNERSRSDREGSPVSSRYSDLL